MEDMDVRKQILEWQVKQKCGHRTVKVILERIQVSGQKPTNAHDHVTRWSLKISPENQVTSLRDSGKSSTECSLLEPNRRNKTKIYTHFFKADKDSGDEDDDDGEIGSDVSVSSSNLEPKYSSDSEFDSSPLLNKTESRKTRNSSITKKPKTGKPEPKIACSICNANIIKKHMGRHFKRKHPNEKLPPPLKEDKVRQRKLNKHKNTPFQCDLCSYECKTSAGLENHILEFHVVDKPFECEICFKSFLTENLLHSHFKRAHESRNFSCRYCPTKFFKDSTFLKEHIATVHKGYNNHHWDSDSEASVSNSNHYLCPVCDTWFLTDADMVVHLNKPESNKPEIKCEICSEPVRTPCGLNLHRQKMHSKPHISNNTSTRTPDQLEARVKSPDTKQGSHSKKLSELSPTSVKNQISSKTFSCVVCSAFFSRRSDLDLHELQENHRRWKCPICGKLLRTKTVLRKHTQSVHSNSRPFGCTHKGCSKSFKLKHGLKRHMTLIHEIDLYPKVDWKFKCDDCSQTFGTSQNLKQHRLTHTEDRPWPCKFCDATYKCSSEAGRHMKKCQVRSEDQRKQFSRFSKASLRSAEQQKRCLNLFISGGRTKSSGQDVKMQEALQGKTKSTSCKNDLTRAATNSTSCFIAGAGNGNDLKLIKQEIDHDNFGDNSFDFDDRLLLPGEESVAKLDMVPKQEIAVSYSD